MQRLRLGVLGEFGQGNLGRDAALVAFVQWIKRQATHVEPVALFARTDQPIADLGLGADATASALNDRWIASPSAQAGLTVAGDRDAGQPKGLLRGAAIGLVAVAARAWPQQVRCARQLAGVVMLGSGPAEGLVSIAGTLRLWSWSWACRWARKPFVMLSVSLPPTPRFVERVLVRQTLRAAAYVSAADSDSARLIRAMRGDAPVSHSPNPMFDLTFESRWESAVDPWQGRTQPMQAGTAVHTYAVSPAHADTLEPTAYTRYIGALARFCAATVRAGHRIVLFATNPGSDRRAMLDLLARVPADVLYGVHMEEGTKVGDIARAVRGVRAVVASRLHGALWGLWGAHPVVRLRVPPHDAGVPCALAAMHDGALTFALENSADDNGEAMIAGLAAIARNYQERRERLHELLPRLRAAIDACYREAFACGGWEDAVSTPVHRDSVAAARDSVAAPGGA